MKKRLILAIIVIVMIPAVAYAAWSNATIVNKDSYGDRSPSLEIENDNLHLINVKGDSTQDFWESSKYFLYYRKKTVSGSWSTPLKVASGIDVQGSWWQFPQRVTSLTTYNGKAHVVYMGTDGTKKGIYYKTNKSGFWPSTPIKLANILPENGSAVDPVITQENGKLYVVYYRTPPGDPILGGSEIYFTKNTNGSWTKPVALTSNNVEDSNPFILARGGKVHLVWATNSPSMVKYRYLYNGVWSKTQIIASKSTGSYEDPVIDVYKGNPYVTFADMSSTAGKAIYAYKTSQGWQKKVVYKSDASNHLGANYDISVAKGKVRIAWNTQGGYFYISSIEDLASTTWKKTLLTGPGWFGASPDIEVDSNNKAHVVSAGVSSDTYNSEIFYSREQ